MKTYKISFNDCDFDTISVPEDMSKDDVVAYVKENIRNARGIKVDELRAA